MGQTRIPLYPEQVDLAVYYDLDIGGYQTKTEPEIYRAFTRQFERIMSPPALSKNHRPMGQSGFTSLFLHDVLLRADYAEGIAEQELSMSSARFEFHGAFAGPTLLNFKTRSRYEINDRGVKLAHDGYPEVEVKVANLHLLSPRRGPERIFYPRYDRTAKLICGLGIESMKMLGLAKPIQSNYFSE